MADTILGHVNVLEMSVIYQDYYIIYNNIIMSISILLEVVNVEAVKNVLKCIVSSHTVERIRGSRYEIMSLDS